MLKKLRLGGLSILFIILSLLFSYLIFNIIYNKNIMIDLIDYSITEIKEYANNNDLVLEIKEIYHPTIKKGILVNQSIKPGNNINNKEKLVVTISLGVDKKAIYLNMGVNELGFIPIMMYHGILNVSSDETAYCGGNVDKDGYNRTKEAFIEDLEMYYKKGYQMISLKNYIDGNINVELGKSPIVLTFDDGNINNIRVIDKKNGELIIDPNSAVGILESFKKKYPDFNVTATFFLNEGLFYQPKYNEDILKWLINNGYDVGNHTMDHIDLADVNKNEVQENIGGMYQILEKIIPGKYLPMLSLPYGSPYSKEHDNFSYILKGQYNDYEYKTKAILRVGWEPDYSPFHKSFDNTFMF